MTDTTGGGMFSKLINPDTAKPKISPSKEEKSINVNRGVSVKHSPTSSKQPSKTKNVLKFEKDVKPRKRRQISAYLSHEQLNLLKQLYFKLNEGDNEIEKSEIVGLAIETLSKMLGTQIPKYSSINRVREYLDTQISKYLSTQVPKNSDT